MKTTITKEAIAEALLKFARSKILDEGVELQPEDKLMNAGLDSHNLLELIVFIERNFGIRIPDHDLTIGNLSSIESLSNCAYENFKMADAG